MINDILAHPISHVIVTAYVVYELHDHEFHHVLDAVAGACFLYLVFFHASYFHVR